jgi:hypothetical protein
VHPSSRRDKNKSQFWLFKSLGFPGLLFLEKENPTIVAGFNKGYADERKSSKYDIISSTCQSKLKKHIWWIYL